MLLGDKVWIAPYISTALIASTIHVQDFRDEVGDRNQGRMTFPIAMPEFSRRMTFVLLITWSLALVVYWALPPVVSAAYVLLGLYLATRVMWLRAENADKTSLQIYMVSACLLL